MYFSLVYLAHWTGFQEVYGKETRDIYADLNRDGSFVDNTTSLICSDGCIISLLQYRFLMLECDLFDNCKKTSEVPLLPDEELQLHQKCSLQTQCGNLKFSERNTVNTVHIKYECIGIQRSRHSENAI